MRVEDLPEVEDPMLALAKAMTVVMGSADAIAMHVERGHLVGVILDAVAQLVSDQPRPASMCWAAVVDFVAKETGLTVTKDGQDNPPGAMVDDWLRSLDPNKLEGLWLSSGDYSTGKGVGFLQKLRDMARADARLWPEG